MSDDDRRAVPPSREELREVSISDHFDKDAAETKEWFKEMRGWLTLLATLAVSVTYQAGLNPPGGFWQDSNGHVAGNPVLRDGESGRRYLTFYYFNATAFMTSLMIFVMLLDQQFYRSETKLSLLTLTAMVEVMSLVGAYIAGSTTDMLNSIYAIVLTVFLFVCAIYTTRLPSALCFIMLFMSPPLYWLAEKGWLPVTEHMRKSVEAAKLRELKEEKKMRAEHNPWRSRRRFSCSCCAC
ncbi:unnamed protein product [Urochloa decumbens]|uniref:PGG domain-containing protein n=1 Tax=Urochloa decumbens TaxID=240449 RepID=A0ABC9DXY0_9POAL